MPNPLDLLLGTDLAARTWLTTHHSPAADAIMLALTGAGAGGRAFLAFGLILVLLRRVSLPAFWQLGLAILVTYLVVDFVAKPLVARARPFDAISDVRVVGDRPVTYAFPSGHAGIACAAAYVLGRLVGRWARWSVWTLAALVAVSRVYVGVHYPLDILAGALVGVACAAFVVGGTRWNDPPDGRFGDPPAQLLL